MGTYDLSILELGDDVFEVKATNGDVNLGGTDWDKAIIDYLVSEFKNENNGIDLLKDSMATQRLVEEAEKAKIILSSALETEINLPFITADATGPKHLVRKLTRAKFEQLTEHLIKRMIPAFNQSLTDANIKVEDINKLVLVGGMTRMPSVINLAKELIKKEPCKGVNPDECVSAGASIQGSVLAGENTDILLLDVTPLSIGLCTGENTFTKMIEKNTTIPCKKSQIFSTFVDNQPAVTIKVATGERAQFNNNKFLGEFNLDGIAPAPRGVPQIEVTFDVDVNGILTVSAKDKGTGKEQSITITNSSNLSKDDIEKMKADAELNAESDKKFKELTEAKNKADSIIFTAEKAINDSKDKLSSELVTEINDAIAKLKDEIKSDDVSNINTATEELDKKMQKIGEAVYKQQSSTPQPKSDDGVEVMDD